MDGLISISGITGVRFARGCHPDDLWTKYFTSSKVVQEYREKHGEPDVVEVRQTFNDRKKACEWEVNVLRKMNAVKDQRWLNQASNGSVYRRDSGKMSDEHRKKISKSLKGNHNCLGRVCQPETKTKLSTSLKGRKFSKEWLNRLRKPKSKPMGIQRKIECGEQTKNTKWYNDGKTNFRLKPDDPTPSGLVQGMLRNSLRRSSGMKGRKHTDETKRKMSESKQGERNPMSIKRIEQRKNIV